MSEFPSGYPRRGEIYWATLPDRGGSEQHGRRPVLVISNDTNNKFAPVVVVAALTRTTPKRDYPQNVRLPAGGPLRDESTVLGNQLYTFDKDALSDCRGSLNALQLSELNAALKVSLAL